MIANVNTLPHAEVCILTLKKMEFKNVSTVVKKTPNKNDWIKNGAANCL